MVDYPPLAFDVCRALVNELEPYLSESFVKLVSGHIRGRQHTLLASLPADPLQHSMEEFKARRQIAAIFKKNADFVDDNHCYDAALKSFLSSEETCKTTNNRIDDVHRKILVPSELVEGALPRMRNYIESVLGDHRAFLNQLPEVFRLTGGATATHSRKNSYPFMKASLKAPATAGALPYLASLSQWWGYPLPRNKVTDWNRVEFVPKNYKTHRTIACEPTGNLPLQLAFDTYCKSQLRKRGIDLSDQFRSQQRALEGSIDGSFATVDLAAASDTISLNTVATLFPDDWFGYLMAVRTPAYRLGRPGDKDYKCTAEYYHKFASMGNGSTFAVETLIFAAACYGVGSDDFTVYGDDIILENHLYGDLEHVLEFLGFSINQEKSFAAGPFRESCGLDAYNGVDITPFYLRGTPRNRAGWCHLVNGIVSIGSPGGPLWELAKRLTTAHSLPLVPYVLDSTFGVWVDVQTAYQHKLIRNTKDKGSYTWIPQVKGFVTKPIGSESTKVVHMPYGDVTVPCAARSGGLFLWHVGCKAHQRNDLWHELTMNAPTVGAVRKLASAVSADNQERSKVELNVTYKRKWVPWRVPGGAPIHLYGWSDYLLG